MEKIDWDKPIQATFGDGTVIKAFTIGENEMGDMWVGIPDPSDVDKTTGKMILVNKYGRSVHTGMRLIENVLL